MVRFFYLVILGLLQFAVAFSYALNYIVRRSAGPLAMQFVTSFEKNEYDVYTLEQTLKQINYTTGKLPKEVICDRGYRGKRKIEDTVITIPKPLPANSTRYQKEKVRIKFRRRAAIEPVIGHLKHDHRMARNFLKGSFGDFVNCVLAGAGFNLKKMLRKIASLILSML
jgi:IS5 family transposase